VPAAPRAATHHVPQGAPTIAAALAAAAEGDTVLVAPGTYLERVLLPSNVTLRGDGPPGAVTIDAALGGPCVDVVAGGAATRLEGCRLVRGRGGIDPGGTAGGGLRIQGGMLTVADCTFEDGQAGFGGGSAALSATVTFRRCTWLRGSATFGGGHFQSAGRLMLEDALLDGPQAVTGGGLFVTNGATATVLGAIVRGARSTGDGAGAHFDACVATLSLVRFEDTVAGGRGGGLAIDAGGQVLASYCTFLRNGAAAGGGAFHVSCDAAAPGGGLAEGGTGLAADCALLSLTHAGILACVGAAPAAGAVTGPAVVRLRSSLVAGNASGLACLDSRSTLDVTCSDLYANGGPDLAGNCAPVTDPTNRAVDPHLCDLAGGDVGLCANSPLVDPGCGDSEWGPASVRCGPCGDTPAAPTSWGRIKVRYR
ncbi:MAG: hypothetical protein ABIP29_05160, partial [Candidatus Eisenbacteria bacterium]